MSAKDRSVKTLSKRWQHEALGRASEKGLINYAGHPCTLLGLAYPVYLFVPTVGPLDFAFILRVLGALGGSKQSQRDDCVSINRALRLKPPLADGYRMATGRRSFAER